MFQVTRNGENRLDVDFAGKLDSQDMRALLEELDQQAQGIEHGRMLYRVDDFQMPSLGALGVELSHLPQMFRFISRFDRLAVVIDKQWVRTVSEIEGALIPGLTIKAFERSQEAAAEAWLRG
ncbi:MAG TPA: STAS/SEC14 domain-containing protein [Pseudomonas sp.]|nr:STAS/SEC14 domain-containing protein [Pseudomonas sp.]